MVFIFSLNLSAYTNVIFSADVRRVGKSSETAAFIHVTDLVSWQLASQHIMLSVHTMGRQSVPVHVFQSDSRCRVLAVETLEDPVLEKGIHCHRYDCNKRVNRRFLQTQKSMSAAAAICSRPPKTLCTTATQAR